MASNESSKLTKALADLQAANNLITVSWSRWYPDWINATPLFEKAATSFRLAKRFEFAKSAFEKAAIGQHNQNGKWQAGKHLETAGFMAAESQDWHEVKRLFKTAVSMYRESGSGSTQLISEVLCRAASLLEPSEPESALEFYSEACSLLEDDEREIYSSDVFRSMAAVLLKLDRFQEAADTYMKIGTLSKSSGMQDSLHKAFLSAIIVHLASGKLQNARNCFNKCTEEDSFMESMYYEAGEILLRHYTENDPESFFAAAKTPEVANLDTVIVRLARNLGSKFVSDPKPKVAMDCTEVELDQEQEDDLT